MKKRILSALSLAALLAALTVACVQTPTTNQTANTNAAAGDATTAAADTHERQRITHTRPHSRHHAHRRALGG